MNRWLAGFLIVLSIRQVSHAEEAKPLKPGGAVDYGKMAFYLEKWKKQKVDGKTMARFVGRLDAGWKVYADLVGKAPRPFKQVAGKPCIAAVPDASLTCGLGCGYIGATGIEVGGFYASDYPLVKKQPRAFPHYYFYEMGLNYYVFGDRHSLFVTGFAVFMRYACMDALKCEGPDAATRKVIEQAEQGHADSKMPFLKAFATLDGLGEKGPRLKDREGKDIHPSDQPVLYAAAMLKLRKDHGGDAWARRFFAALHRCPEVKPDTKEKALQQSLSWLVSASVAARKDLTPVFCDRWRMPLPDATRKALKAVDWSRADLGPPEVVKGLPAAALGPGDHTRTLTVGGRKRTYLVHVPKGHDPKKATPVVLALHGAAMNGPMMVWFSGLNKTSDKAGFVVVYPSGTGTGPFLTWNAGGFRGKMAGGRPDDVAFVAELLDDLATVVKVDAKRVYASGMSNGGMMCYRLAAELSDRIAAIAPVAGTIAIDESKPKRPVPVIHFHGTKDTFVTFEAAKGRTRSFMRLKGVEESIQTWVKLNGCKEKPRADVLSKDGDETKVTRRTFGKGKDGAEVVLVVIEGGGHTWPGMKPPASFMGKSAMNVSANDLMWEFFKKHRLK